ncbi:MAG: lipoyl(octanoyl) transferase LipB [Gammaproteobacteria bacterium]|nr:lipoyl(octanoyl) transferase LipB [Pseudomonadota bacterium]MCH8261452.1 lipoyl(octanoyl) transferase LipB [Pseudomonadota bacterium]MCH9047587.1 lipoyl(octanoyl) transferase LipB [Pseudomonadota bacterium]TDJ19656.1 MAG: lipoyl(octanoyl) transferase LipB [Gammaproteobacteria bacterium]
MTPELIIRTKGFCHYDEIYTAMSRFTDNRNSKTTDEIWCLQHPPVYTLGLNGQSHHIIDTGNIPVIETDRGGQITYHGPGQLMVYLLMDIKRKAIGVKDFVHRMEQSVIDMLHGYGIEAILREDAPGVYVNHRKISALGIRIRRGCSYHGLSINVDMDLAPYNGIHPCGFPELEITQMKAFGIDEDLTQVTKNLLPHLLEQMEYFEKDVSVINEVCSDQAA